MTRRVRFATAVLTMGAATVAFSQAPSEADLQRVANSAWRAARALAPLGGAMDQLGAVREYLNGLETLRVNAAKAPSVEGARLVLAIRYADAATRAAIAAAQDERDEMKVFLGHARALDAQLSGMGGAAVWPRPMDELEGELWFEVDGYTEAHEAYLRAIANGGGARAWLGLARANDRLGNRLAACDAYRRAASGELEGDDRAEVLEYLNSTACQASQ